MAPPDYGHTLRGLTINLPVRDIDAALAFQRDVLDDEAAARRLGYSVLDGATNKPHGLREAYILDPDGDLWVPDIPLGK